MTNINRRDLIAATAAGMLAPAVADAAECIRPGFDWQTMSLAERNAAYNNTGQVGSDFAKQKTEEWTAASKTLREKRPQHLNLAYGPAERTKWDLYPSSNPQAPCFIHIHGGYWQRGSKEIFACLAEGALARGWSAALPGYTLGQQGNLTQITQELRTALDWFEQKSGEHGISGPVILTGWSAGGHLTSYLANHPKVAAALTISGVFDLAALRDSPHVNDVMTLTETEVETLSPMRLQPANKPVSISYGSKELPAMIATSRDYHAYRSGMHLAGDLIPVPNTNHFTILDELRRPDGHLTRATAFLAEKL